MSKKPIKEHGRSPERPHGRSRQLHEWRIIRIRSSPAAYVGHVRAADEKEAINRAIHEFQITNPEDQKRLMAQRVS